MTGNLPFDGDRLLDQVPPPEPPASVLSQATLAECFVDWTKITRFDLAGWKGFLLLCDPNCNMLAAHPILTPSLPAVCEQLINWSLMNAGVNAISVCARDQKPAVICRTEHDRQELGEYHSLAEPISSKHSEFLGILGLFYQNGKDQPDNNASVLLAAWATSLQFMLSLTQARTANHQLSMLHQYYESELKKKEVLLQVVNKLHANMDVDSVLSEITTSMLEIYPGASVELFLSHDSETKLEKVKPLNFKPDDDNMPLRAYLDGRTVFNKDEDGLVHSLAVPLRGQQGVYGVLHITDLRRPASELDLKFIMQLADSAGTAIENARLHESSTVLINELRLINEITRRINQSLKLQEVFQFASDELIKILAADYGLIMQIDHESGKMIVQSSNLPEMARDTFTLDYGFAGVMLQTKEPIIISDYVKNPKVRSKLMESTGARSMIGSPIIVGSDVVGVILMAHRRAHYFSYNNYKLLQVLSGHIGLAITNASLHAEVRRMVITDNLTGLFARHYLDDQINQLQKKDFCGSLIVVDIDHFKSINDTYGHQTGDQILKQVSSIIRSSIRETDIAARWGGEELAVYLPQLMINQTIHIAERICKRIEQETEPNVTASCGISQWSWEDEKISVESLFYRADMALYEAKRSGRNQIKIG
jgi:diguanylate cyclase (GGDEF)-like protein